MIATSAMDAQVAVENGTNRIELVSGITEGGLTPSYDLIKEAVSSVIIPVNVMIRPHCHSFCYSKEDIRTMMEEIKVVRKLGASGIVLGALKCDYTIDVTALQKLLSVAGTLDVTFHRAFDEVGDQEAALNTLFDFPQINRILTSGGEQSVIQATNQIKRLVQLTKNKPCSIIAGSGLTVENVNEFIDQTGVQEIHIGSGVRCDGQALKPIDPERLRSIVKVTRNKES